MPIKVFSFFSGLGLLDLGFETAGFNIAAVNEINPQYLHAYTYARNNHVHIPEYGYSNIDIRNYLKNSFWNTMFPNYNANDNETIIGFIGGPPCPDFSIAGKNAGVEGINGQLTEVYIRLIIKRKPDFFVFENVKGLCKTKKHSEYYENMKHRLRKNGYSLFSSIENALEYGTPQNRDRLILVGFKREKFGNHIDFNLNEYKLYNLEEIKQVDWPTTSAFVAGGELDCPNNIIVNLTVEHWFQLNHVYDHPNCNDYFQPKKIDRFSTIPEGKTNGKSFKRLHRWRYSPTAAYGNNEVHLHPYFPRRLSIAEALAIQSVPANFILPNDLPLSTKFKMVGNGVPFLLAYGVARSLRDWLDIFANEEGNINV